jgi:hypothetical protein
MAKKLSPKELSELRAAYLSDREDLLIRKVDALSIKLFDKVFNEYLIALEQNDGKLVRNDRNISLVKGLDNIYQVFQRQYNIPVVKEFITHLQGIAPLNESYFKSITGSDVRSSLIKVQAVVNKRLGVDGAGNLKPGGFADKFIKDPFLLRTIKSETGKALTNKMGFQEFRVKLKETIQGNPAQKLSGGLQQYYRGYAYDTFARVDRLNQDVFAKDLGLRYFFWSGGVIKTTRPICRYCNGKIVDSEKIQDLEFSDLKPEYQPGLNEDWVPMTDLGQFNCRHRKDYILSSVAERMPGRWLDVDSLLK